MHPHALLAVALMWASPAPAADSAHCDSKPFTLKKPAPMPAKPAATPTPPAAKPATIQPISRKATPAPKPYMIGCKQPPNH